MDLLSQMALGGHWGPLFSPSTVPAKAPAAPSVLFIKYTVQLCVCVCVGEVMGVGGDSQGWETHVTVALRVFVRRTACLVRLGGYSQLLSCSATMHPDPPPPSLPPQETTAT